jgi:hypothetical protein
MPRKQFGMVSRYAPENADHGRGRRSEARAEPINRGGTSFGHVLPGDGLVRGRRMRDRTVSALDHVRALTRTMM